MRNLVYKNGWEDTVTTLKEAKVFDASADELEMPILKAHVELIDTMTEEEKRIHTNNRKRAAKIKSKKK